MASLRAVVRTATERDSNWYDAKVGVTPRLFGHSATDTLRSGAATPLVLSMTGPQVIHESGHLFRGH
jgi:hypothetical protein